MYIQGTDEYKWHLEHWGKHKDFGLKDFIPMLTYDKYEPAEWIRLFREAGAEYIVPVAEHHDGFQNYKSDLSHWNAFEKGPHRDIMGDLLEAAEQDGMTIGASSHRVEHWWFLSHGREFDSDVTDETTQFGDLYWPAQPEAPNVHDLHSKPGPSDEFLEDWLLRCCEIVDRYHPRIMYFDWWIQHEAVKPYLKKFTAYFFNRMEPYGGCVVNYKHDAYPFGIGVPDIERGAFAEAKPFLWQSDTSVMRGSWCYSEQVERRAYKPAREVIWTLADCVSKNGRLLINFGPKADGTLSDEDVSILKDMAAWMKVNDEAIHGTGLWRKAEEGPTKSEEGQFTDVNAAGYTSQDYRFTCRGGTVYAIEMVCPDDGKATISSLRKADAHALPLWHGIIKDVQVLGCDTPVTWTRDEEGLHVDMGEYRSSMPVVIKIITD